MPTWGRGPRELPEIGVDCSELEAQCLAGGPTSLMLCGHDRLGESYVGTNVVDEGPWLWTCRRSITDLLGFVRVRAFSAKVDGEPAIAAFVRGDISRISQREVLHIVTPPGDAQANGLAETAVKRWKPYCRVAHEGLERKLGGGVVSDDAAVLSWLPAFAMACVNRFSVGVGGRTAHHRGTGRRWSRPSVLFFVFFWGGDRVQTFPATRNSTATPTVRRMFVSTGASRAAA